MLPSLLTTPGKETPRTSRITNALSIANRPSQVELTCLTRAMTEPSSKYGKKPTHMLTSHASTYARHFTNLC